MTKSVQNIASALVFISIFIFALFFAFKVVSSINSEETLVKTDISTLKYEENDYDCSSNLLINASFAVVLAGLWNAKKMIKIGSI